MPSMVSLGATIPETVPQVLLYATPPKLPAGCEPAIVMPVILDCSCDSDTLAESALRDDLARGIATKNGATTSIAHRTMLAEQICFRRGVGIDHPSKFRIHAQYYANPKISPYQIEPVVRVPHPLCAS